MNLEHDFFCKLNINSNATAHIKYQIDNADESNWKNFLELSMLLLEPKDLQEDPKILQLVKDIGDVNRIAVYRNKPNTCYSWHVDSIRQGAINMLIEGFDSMCLFGDQAPGRQYINLERLQHESNCYYLMNIKKYHSVYNFNNQRYILSLGIPDKSYDEVKDYLKVNNMLGEL